jgi:hypothetical protein
MYTEQYIIHADADREVGVNICMIIIIAAYIFTVKVHK